MKYVVFCTGILIVVFTAVGFYVKNYLDYLYGNRIIGLSVLALSFVFMPLFIYYRYKSRKISDYSLKRDIHNKSRNR